MIAYGDSFKDIGADLVSHYVNPNQLQDMSKRLHVCETLFGDFDAKVLVLLQDAADADKLIDNGAVDRSKPVLRHFEGALTNKRLVDWFGDYFQVSITGDGSSSCGLYYANAIWLIKRFGGMSGPIVRRSEVLEACTPVLCATLKNLKNLEIVFAFGMQAYDSISRMLGVETSWQSAKDSLLAEQVIFAGRTINLVALNHPAARVSHKLTKERLHNFLDHFDFQR